MPGETVVDKLRGDVSYLQAKVEDMSKDVESLCEALKDHMKMEEQERKFEIRLILGLYGVILMIHGPEALTWMKTIAGIVI